MKTFLSRLKRAIDPIILKNGRRVELVNFLLELISAGIAYCGVRYDFLHIKLISAIALTLFVLLEVHIVVEYRKMPEEERNEIHIIEWEHPYYTLAVLAFITSLTWIMVIWEIL